MPFFHEYPYESYHEMNLDWIINMIKKLTGEMHDFKVINKITFFGDWDITKQYPAWSVVNNNGDGYISIKPVPVGVDISNTDYWILVANYSALYADMQNRIVALENAMDVASFKQTEKHKAIFFGDSLTYGDLGGLDHLRADKPYPAVYGEISGLTVDNLAFGGSTAANNSNVPDNTHYLKVQVDSVNFADYDQMFIAHGANDYTYNSPLGDLYNGATTSFIGAYNYAIAKAYSENPEIEIILLTTFYAQSYSKAINGCYGMNHLNGLGLSINDYISAVKDIAAVHNLRCIDIVDAIGINDYNYPAYLNDDIHMNQKGYTMVGRYIAKQLSFPKAYTIKDARTYDAKSIGLNMLAVDEYPNNGIALFADHPEVVGGSCSYLDLAGTTTYISKKKHYFREGQTYTFSCYAIVDPGTAITIQVNQSGQTSPIFGYGVPFANRTLIPILCTFVALHSGYGTVDVVLTSNGSPTGIFGFTNICINAGYRTSNRIANDTNSGVYYKPLAYGASASEYAADKAGVSVDRNGIVHLKGCVNYSLPANAERELFSVPSIFNPGRDCVLMASTQDGKPIAIKMNSVNGMFTVLTNSDIVAASVIDLNGLSYSGINQPDTITFPY